MGGDTASHEFNGVTFAGEAFSNSFPYTLGNGDTVTYTDYGYATLPIIKLGRGMVMPLAVLGLALR